MRAPDQPSAKPEQSVKPVPADMATADCQEAVAGSWSPQQSRARVFRKQSRTCAGRNHGFLQDATHKVVEEVSDLGRDIEPPRSLPSGAEHRIRPRSPTRATTAIHPANHIHGEPGQGPKILSRCRAVGGARANRVGSQGGERRCRGDVAPQRRQQSPHRGRVPADPVEEHAAASSVSGCLCLAGTSRPFDPTESASSGLQFRSSLTYNFGSPFPQRAPLQRNLERYQQLVDMLVDL